MEAVSTILAPLLEEDPPPPPAECRAYRVEAPLVTFGLVVESSYVTSITRERGLTASLPTHLVGQVESRVLRYCIDRGWRVAEVEP